MTATELIPRTCTEVVTDERASAAFAESQPLSAYRDVPAYVLLGEPGAGKTIEFEQECRALGDSAEKIFASTFSVADIASRPEWRNKVLFIDGLDETRVSGGVGTNTLYEIQARLVALGRPRFRISCRAADWFGSVDRRPLTEASPDDEVTTLCLNALDRSAVRRYLKARSPNEDPVAFIPEAESLGLGSMLDNPLTLKLLLKTIENGGWPSTRKDAFERSCRVLAQELNEEHPRAAFVHPPEQTLDAAGRLCAIQLLSGKDGYSLTRTDSDAGFIPAAEVAADIVAASQRSDLELRDVFATSLFVPSGERRRQPQHRQIAEYLAAKHIADLVDAGSVPFGRVRLALTSRIDDRIVTDLRGLAAWLSALSGEARRTLIASDPVGIAIYGDIADWPVQDRRTLLEAVAANARPEDLWGRRWFDKGELRYRYAIGWSFRSLCMPDMADTLGEYFDAAQSGAVPSHIAELLLVALSEAEDCWLDQLSCLAPRISQLALDMATQPDVRLAALLAFARIEPSEPEVEAALVGALDAILERRLADPNYRIGETLLRLLYPKAITPSGIWAYAPLLRRGSVSGPGWDFWRTVLCDETSIEQLPQLLDGFAEEAERLWPILSSAFANEVPLRLLNRALRHVGREIEPERVYRWIAAVVANYEQRRSSTDETAELAAWLTDNALVTQQLRKMWVARSVADDVRFEEKHFLREFLLADYPQDFISWCIGAARTRQRVEPEVARAFVREAYYGLPKMYERFGTSIDDLRAEIGEDDVLTEFLEELTSRSATSAEIDSADAAWRRELAETEARLERERQERQRDWSSHLREEIGELRSNSFSAPNLHTLALAYFGLLVKVDDGKPPVDRLADLVGDDSDVLEAVIEALRNAPTRPDVPSVERTAELTAESKHDWLAYPVLAGLTIRETEGSLAQSWLSADQRRQAVAIAATALLKTDQQPSWLVDWLNEDPAFVLDVLHRCAVAEIRKGDAHLSMLNWLLEVEGLDAELYRFRLGLLRSMSVRMPRAQMRLFDYLVGLVLQHGNTELLADLTSRKLASTSMTDAQRVRWLAIDALNRGGDALRALDEFLESKPACEAELAPFLSQAKLTPFWSSVERPWSYRIESDADTADIEAWIKIVGRVVPPRDRGRPGEAVSIGPAEEVTSLMSGWIDELGSQPTADAGAALDNLVADERLDSWRDRLEFARDKQRRLHSDASYEQMDVSDVIALLCDGPPANAADLHALLCDHLRDVGEHIRGDNADLWRLFWADDQNSPPKQTKQEDSCRDALLGVLRGRLPAAVDAQPEGQYAAERRSDIRAASRNFNVPVEIKKNSHPDLWSAIHDQLIAKYTTDPETGGHGIYAVLWFGSDVEGYPRHPVDGDRPGAPLELACRLNETLSPDQRRKINVVVLDVTRP